MGGVPLRVFCHTHAILWTLTSAHSERGKQTFKGILGGTSQAGGLHKRVRQKIEFARFPSLTLLTLAYHDDTGFWWCESPQPGLKESAFLLTVCWLSLTLVGSLSVEGVSFHSHRRLGAGCVRWYLTLAPLELSRSFFGPHTIFYRYFRGCVKGQQFWPGKGSGFLHGIMTDLC